MKEDPLFEDEVIEIRPRRRRKWLVGLLLVIVFLFLFGSPLMAIYIDALWFGSIGYADVYWYKFRLGGMLFAVFLVLTFLIVRLGFALLTRALPELKERRKIKLANIQDLRDINLLSVIYRPAVWVISIALAFNYGVSFAQEWSEFALYLNAQTAGAADPVFNIDVSFYLFKLPALNLISGWLTTLTLILFVALGGIAFYHSYVERMQGLGSSETRRRVMKIVNLAAAPLAIALAVSAYLSRYDLLDKRHNLFTGMNYADYNVRLPALTVLTVVLLLAAVGLVVNALAMRRQRVIILIAVTVAGVWLVGLLIIPQITQSFSVNPNELAKESAFIQRNIDMTRRAFALERFDEKPFLAVPTLTAEEVQANQPTIENIRLWEEDTLKDNYSQNQAIRTYYEFRQPDVDRYRINGQMRQVMISAREMNVDHLQDKSRNWINQHLVYTHGYGVAMSPAGAFTAEGGPQLLLKNMPVESAAPEIKVTRPEIYFGEVTNSHVYIHTKPQGTTQPEFNYPAPDNTDSYSEYEGEAGIEVGGWFRQLALSYYLGDGTNLLLSDYISSQSRVLIRRNITERVRNLAPFLLFDSDPYIVITDDGRLVWIIDAFTYSDRYPYSTAYSVGNTPVNYIRNSVKAVVDAYTGSVKFYVFEPDDPVIKSYQSIFPSLFVAAGEMPEDLRGHIRYPNLLARVQSLAYTLYHIQNAQTFYNREDLWSIAVVDSSTDGKDPQPMSPYYVVMRLPDEQELEFISLLPFTPAGPNRNNMIGLIAQRSDGDKYGHTIIFSYPKNITVNGPAQIKARVNQDAQLSQLVTLWNQQGSRVIRGNLQAIPIAHSLLYVEPIYLQAVNSPLPELKQVAIATQDKLVSAKTFDEALALLFPGLSPPGEQPPETPTTQKPVESANKPAQPAQSAQPAVDLSQLAQNAQQLLSDYERLTSQGRHREAGEKLDQLKQAIAEMNRRRGGK